MMLKEKNNAVGVGLLINEHCTFNNQRPPAFTTHWLNLMQILYVQKKVNLIQASTR